MVRPSIKQIRNFGPALSYYRWNIIFTKLPTGANITSDELNLRAFSTDVPGKTHQMAEIMLKGHKVKVPSIVEYNGEFTMTFVEGVDAKVLNFLNNWSRLLWDPETGVQAAKNDYEAGIIMQLLDNQDNPVYQFDVHGVKLQTRELGGQLDGSNTEVMKPTVTVSYDYFTEDAL